MHEYTVELRIHGAELVPANITADLGLEPSLVREVGERRSNATVWKEALWAYNGFSPDDQRSWTSLEEGLAFVLDKLEPVRLQIDNYKQHYDIVWWCGHFQSSFDGGPTLSSRLLQRLADFGVELFIDTYFADPA